MYYDQTDERSYIYYVKLPEIEQKFAIGCTNLRAANVGYIIDLARDVAERNRYEYTDEPTVFCQDIGKIVIDNTALSFCISKGYTFEVFNGIKEVKQKLKPEPKQQAKEERNEEPKAEPRDKNEESKVLANPDSE